MRKLVFIVLLSVSLAACGSSGPDGLYIMTRMAYGSTLNIEAYRFEDGNVVRNPVVPGDSLDVEGERKVHPEDVGTFELDGDQMTMKLGSGESSSDFEPDGDCFNWDMGIFCRVEPFGDDELDGTFEGGTSARTPFGVAINSRTIVFSDDGTYTTESAGSVSSSNESSTVNAGATGGEKGEYEIDGYTITFRPEGGEERVLTAFPYDDGTEGPQPRRIYLGGTMLKQRAG